MSLLSVLLIEFALLCGYLLGLTIAYEIDKRRFQTYKHKLIKFEKERAKAEEYLKRELSHRTLFLNKKD
jgi:hypothetical protein